MRQFSKHVSLCCHFAAKEHWNQYGQNEIKRIRQLKPNIAVAKNVIFFLGDGMGISTVTAARILKGQLNGKSGEEDNLSFETFPHVGLSKVGLSCALFGRTHD